MKDDKKKKKIIPADNSKKKVKKINPKHIEEQESLFARAKSSSPANKKINKPEVVQLRGGGEINVDDYINENYITGRKTHYFKPFYLSLAGLFGVNPEIMKPFVKPHFVPVFKNSFILGRFPQRVVDRLKQKNKYVGNFRRQYYFYQLITKKADEQYRDFIRQSEEMAAKCKGEPKKFIVEYCTMYGLPIQLNLFDNII